MKIRFEYDSVHEEIVLIPSGFSSFEWSSFTRILSDYGEFTVSEGKNVCIPYRAFLGIRVEIARYIKNHGVSTEYTTEIRDITPTFTRLSSMQ